ncbi:LuxR C-terminal-related transcriptional regulator [Streptomyces flavotricini]|uniref:LuxR C-terminal-related transcriptional regulator n=1 Tax=Streptomyces flavotricini TaxID=66888 RepID=A0ABS8EHK7_9ACTN|nr:LuxR C-terminal-related transcriptional regulator [Streptomyces flavotricini]MCC0100576.1 LuxR C-terminal-related transcriptional regulator [Streptomyces flavotricini]
MDVPAGDGESAGIQGLDGAAVLLYRWTVVHAHLTRDTLARAAAETGIDDHEAARALDSLLAACLLQELPTAGTQGVRWQPVSPQAAASRLLSDRDAALRAQEEALRTQRRRIQQEQDSLAALTPVYLQARQHAFPQGTIDHLPDKFAVRNLLTEVIDSCHSEVLVSKHGGSFPVAALREALPRDLALLARGIRMRSLYQHATRFDQPTRTHAEQLVAAGAEIRTLPEVLPQMIIVDQSLALLPARSGGALLIREPDLLGYLLDVFERDWANATAYATGPQAAHGVSQAMKQSILVLLAKGFKDDTIARRLGISLRTCRRHVSELLESLGAHSRFEAGVIAERQGLTQHRVPASATPVEVAEVAGPSPAPVASGCPACGGSMPVRPGGPVNGRPARYCSPSCRSRAYRERTRHAASGRHESP